jgi:hypothetical protein
MAPAFELELPPLDEAPDVAEGELPAEVDRVAVRVALAAVETLEGPSTARTYLGSI